MGMLFDGPANQRPVPLTIYTDQLIVRGIVLTSQHRVTDILNMAPEPHLVLEDVTIEEYGSSEPPLQAEFAQVNLGSVLFAVSLTAVETTRELRTPKVSERALISVPPFRIVGSVHLLADRGLRASLAELRGLFVPVTDATFSAERVGETRQTVPYLAVNHARAQVFAPFHETDPWAGVARPATSALKSSAVDARVPGAVATGDSARAVEPKAEPAYIPGFGVPPAPVPIASDAPASAPAADRAPSIDTASSPAAPLTSEPPEV